MRRTFNARPCTFTIINSPKYSVSSVMGYVKGKSSLMIFERYANSKYQFSNRHFW